MPAPIIVVGHKNPDNDSISAAVGYAYLKNDEKRAGRCRSEARVRPRPFGPHAARERLDPGAQRPAGPRGGCPRACARGRRHDAEPYFHRP